jgi:hypothetical protein
LREEVGRFFIAGSYVRKTKGQFQGESFSPFKIDCLPPLPVFVFHQTAEIIALLYEATQGPPLPIDGPPALNPTGTLFITIFYGFSHYETGGVTGKQPPPVNGLQYKKDPSRQGSGVFIAHGATRKNYEDLLPGVLVSPSDSGSEGKESMFKISSFQSPMIPHYYFTSWSFTSHLRSDIHLISIGA